jgi:predicted outer membrane repeat protein
MAALTDCLVSGNSAASGGGIYAAPSGTVTLTGTRVANNKKDNIVGTVTYN